ncbi:dual specificity phosphatase [Corchorus olitorius]|uniref:Dual specificity phosphatase n=1 Tax=Corchorus olitorius TaxID=93759 RepID=A0A1R3IYC8_9ROSI|nr:dual specificity phosphatase [Corchorus olitorius]
MDGLTINAVIEEATRPSAWIYPMAAERSLATGKLSSAPLRRLKFQCIEPMTKTIMSL